MAINIIISRRVLKEQEAELAPILKQLFELASKQKGYLFGETLYSRDDPEEQLVISVWKTMKDWENYQQLDDSQNLHRTVDLILGSESPHRIFFKKALGSEPVS